MRLGRKRKEIRKLAKQARERSHKPAEPEILDGIPVEPTPDEQANAGKSTLVEAVAVPDPMLEPLPDARAESTRVQSQDETVEAVAIRARIPDAGGETEGPLDAEIAEPEPPARIGFACPCGARLVATKKSYDKRMKCGSCRTLLLVTLVWNSKEESHEIVPFRVDLPDVEA